MATATPATPPSEQEKLQQIALDQLLQKTGRMLRSDEIVFEGTQIKLPINVPVPEIIVFLQGWVEDQEEGTAFQREFTYKIWDVAHAMSKVLREEFGALRHTGTFLSPPQMVDVPCGPGETVQVPFGQFSVPALPNVEFSVQASQHEKYGPVGLIGAYGPKKHQDHIEGIFDLVGEYLKTNSLYQGKAFTDDQKPEFIDVGAIDPGQIVFSDKVRKELRGCIYTRLQHPKELARLNIKFRSTHLLEGAFGVGKTEALNLIAKEAVERGKTFIKVAPGGDLLQAVHTAVMYAPSIVAFEDVETIAAATTDDENERIKQVLEAFDGQQAKLGQVMVILTTNHVGKLHKGMVRPGRIDSIIHIDSPDAESIRKLVEVRTPAVLAPDIKWDDVTAAMKDYFPSFVVESSNRAMLYAVDRTNGAVDVLTTEDLVDAANEMRPQFELHQGAKTGQERPAIEQSLIDVMRKALKGEGDDESSLVEAVAEVVANEGEETREFVKEKATAIARHTSREAHDTRVHESNEAEATREHISEVT